MEIETTTPEAAPVEVTDTLPEAVEIETPEYTTTDDDQSTAPVESDDTAEGTTDPESEQAGLRQADYTRKTQELAEIRKALNERTQKLDTYVTQGEALIGTLAQEFQAEFQGINWGELAANDPAQYVQKRHAFDERQRKLALAVGQLQQAKQQQAATEAESNQQRIFEEQKRLIERLPEWKDAKKAAAEAAKVREYLTKSGYGPDEVNGVTDHRAVILARKAMLYDEMAAKMPKPSSISGAPPPVPKAPTKASGEKDPAQMTDKEFAQWRAKQIAQRR